MQQVNSLYNNPFALTHAKAAWADTTSSLAGRLVKTVTGAAYDVYVANPINLTVGNINRAFLSDANSSTAKKVASVALFIAGSLYTIMLYGATIHMAGRAIEALGEKTGSHLADQAGKLVKLAGEKLFVVGAVPVYATVYILPKKLVENFPRAALFVAKKIQACIHFTIHNVLVPFIKHVVIPVARNIDRARKWVYSVAKPIVDVILDKATHVAQFLFKNVLKPLWQYVVSPTLKALSRGIVHLVLAARNAAHTIAKKIAEVVSFVVEKALFPFWNQVLQPALQTLARSIRLLANVVHEALVLVAKKVREIVQYAVVHFVAPAMKVIAEALSKVITYVGRYAAIIANETYKALAVLGEKIMKAASWVFTNALAPAARVIMEAAVKAGTFIGQKIIAPVASLIQSVVSYTAEKASEIFAKVIMPIAEGISNACYHVGQKIVEINNALYEAASHTWQKVFT